MNSQTQRTLTVLALVMALGVLSVQVVDLITFLQAEAACEKGRPGPAINASKGRCLDRGTI
jgi:hypothetical protein